MIIGGNYYHAQNLLQASSDVNGPRTREEAPDGDGPAEAGNGIRPGSQLASDEGSFDAS